MRIFFFAQIFIFIFRDILLCRLSDDMAVSPRSDGVLELVDLILLSNGVSFSSLLFGLDFFKALDDGINVVTDVLNAI